MIAVDTNVLIYAHHSEAPEHSAAKAALTRLAQSPGGWAIPMPCLHEFLAVTTGPAFGKRRTPVEVAFETVHAWTSHSACVVLTERDGHLNTLEALCLRAGIVGGAMHDARIAAICLSHNVQEFWTCNRDFGQFPDLVTRDPLIPSMHEPVAGMYRAQR
jgi:uncharacterized protein